MIDDGQWPRADSLVRSLQPRRAGLAAVDEALFDFLLAHLDGPAGYARRYEAARRLVALAPGSEFEYKLAMAAYDMDRPHEALAALNRFDPNKGWVRNLPYQWYLRGLAAYRVGRLEEALDGFRRAERLKPGTCPREWGARILAATGREAELNDWMARFAVDSVDGRRIPGDRYMWVAARTLKRYGHAAAARRMFELTVAFLDSSRAVRRAIETDSVYAVAQAFRKAGALYNLGRLEESRTQYARLDTIMAAGGPSVQTVLQRKPDFWPAIIGTLGSIAVRVGDSREADRATARLRALPIHDGTAEFFLARIAAVRGDRAGAVTYLRKALPDGWELAEIEPDFEGLREYGPYLELMTAVN
jgi:tetratricopeptide (TPR) repeat protein